MLTLILVFINTLLLLLLLYPTFIRIFSKDMIVPYKEIEVDGYDSDNGPVLITDTGSYDYTSVFDNSGWKNLIGTKDTTNESGVHPSYVPNFSLSS